MFSILFGNRKNRECYLQNEYKIRVIFEASGLDNQY